MACDSLGRNVPNRNRRRRDRGHRGGRASRPGGEPRHDFRPCSDPRPGGGGPSAPALGSGGAGEARPSRCGDLAKRADRGAARRAGVGAPNDPPAVPCGRSGLDGLRRRPRPAVRDVARRLPASRGGDRPRGRDLGVRGERGRRVPDRARGRSPRPVRFRDRGGRLPLGPPQRRGARRRKPRLRFRCHVGGRAVHRGRGSPLPGRARLRGC